MYAYIPIALSIRQRWHPLKPLWKTNKIKHVMKHGSVISNHTCTWAKFFLQLCTEELNKIS